MIPPGTRILLVEDSEADSRFIEILLAADTEGDPVLECAPRLADALRLLVDESWDVVLLDLNLADSSGFETFARVRAAAPEVPLILLTGQDDEEMASRTVSRGAQDFLVKGQIDSVLLGRAIRYAMERVRIERALRESEADLRALFEHAVQGIYRSSMERRFVRVNPALVEMLGYANADDVLALDLGRDIWVDPADREEFLSRYLVESGNRQDRVEERQVRWRKLDGSEITVRLTGRVLRTDWGGLQGFEMFAEDITDRLALQTRLRQAQKMEAIGQLSGGIAHEINTILTVVMTEMDLIAERLPRGEEQLADELMEVKRAARRGAGVIRKLLGFSRRERLELQPLDLSQLVLESREFLRRTVPDDIQLELDADADCIARVDPGAVERILLALASNARDAMPEGGDLRVRLGPVTLDEADCTDREGAKPGRYALLSVGDDGVGMSAVTREHAFEPFFTSKGAAGGDGLGLAMVYGFVKQHDGYVEIESELGVGTEVRIYLPRMEVRAPVSAREEAAEQLRGGSETILVVEDDEGLRRSATRGLERFGFRVLTAADGEEGLAVFMEHRATIDLVFSDVVMPEMGGEEMCRRILEEGGTPKILFTSGYSAADFRNGEFLDASLPLLPKPWSVDELIRSVRHSLDQSPAHGPQETDASDGAPRALAGPLEQ